MKPTRRVIFYINKGVHLLDLAGAVQSFYEAGEYGEPYEILFVADDPGPVCSAGLPFGALVHYSTLEVRPGDLLIVAGFDLRYLGTARKPRLRNWLKKAAQTQAAVCSICTGAFLLAEAGLLNDKTCTTHWKYTQRLQKEYPGLTVLPDRLFVKSGNIYTSAGVTTGLDMALYLLEERHGPEFAFKIAREMVVYIRRDGSEPQESIYLQFRAHVNQHVHTVQDWMIHNLQKKIRLEELAA
jgi:transcriptional regulator GlxA family with amidase domain